MLEINKCSFTLKGTVTHIITSDCKVISNKWTSVEIAYKAKDGSEYLTSVEFCRVMAEMASELNIGDNIIVHGLVRHQLLIARTIELL